MCEALRWMTLPYLCRCAALALSCCCCGAALPERPRRAAVLASPALLKPCQWKAANSVAAPAQALDVTAEPDRPPLRTESRPPGGAAGALARAWPAIGGAGLAALLLAGAGLALARRRQRPLMDALLERCRLGRRRAGWQPQVPLPQP